LAEELVGLEDDVTALRIRMLCGGAYDTHGAVVVVRAAASGDPSSTVLAVLHLPSGIGVNVINDRRAWHRRAEALRIIRSRLLVPRGVPQDVREYMHDTEQLVSDPRTGMRSGNLWGVLDGNLDAFLHAAAETRHRRPRR
jgi:hypothetical protein